MQEEDLRTRLADITREREDAEARYVAVSSMLERSNDQAHMIYNASKIIASTHLLSEMIPQITGLLRKAVNSDRSTLFLLSEDRVRLEMRYADGFGHPSPVTIAVGDGLPGRIVEVGEHSHVHDLGLFYETFNDFIHLPGEQKRPGSYIGIALKSRQAVIGTLGISTDVRYGLSVEDMDFLALISPLLSSGIEKAMLFEKTERLSRTDGLTGLFNHRVFEEMLRQEVSRRRRTGAPLALIMLDVDHFKRFNDSYGHQEGDAVLRELAGVIRKSCRSGTIDSCFRYGGEEFAILLPEEDLPNALMVAERARRAVEEHPFSIRQKDPAAKVTISLGVAVAEKEMDPEVLVKLADEALYRAKRGGRNRVGQ